jgi:TRAP-type C4-dicarboxylate transport system substrate-binding protein
MEHFDEGAVLHKDVLVWDMTLAWLVIKAAVKATRTLQASRARTTCLSSRPCGSETFLFMEHAMKLILMGRRALALAMGALVGCGSLMLATASAAANFEWRLNISTNEARSVSKNAARFAQRVEEKSGGRLKIKVFYGNSLGFSESDTLRVLKSGGVEMSMIYAGYLARDLPDTASALPQGVILSPGEMVQIMPQMYDIYRDSFAKWDVTTVGWLHDAIYDISIFCKDNVGSLQALKGKKVRVWSKDQIDTFARLGISAQIIGQNDLYLALQTGVVDCSAYVAGVAKTISLQEVTKYAARLHTSSALPSAISVSNRHYNQLPKDLQAVLLEAGTWLTAETEKTLTDFSLEEAARKEFAEKKTVTWLGDFPKADQLAFYKAANDVWAERVQTVGREAPKYRDRLNKALEAARANR